MSKRKKYEKFRNALNEFLTKDSPACSFCGMPDCKHHTSLDGGSPARVEAGMKENLHPAPTFAVGYKMQDALELSYLHRAYRSYDATAGLMTNGFRFWLVDTTTLEARDGLTVLAGIDDMARMDWLPVYGNERGYTLECQS